MKNTKNGHIEVVKSLLANGADPTIRSHNTSELGFRYMMALELAREKNRKEIVAL